MPNFVGLAWTSKNTLRRHSSYLIFLFWQRHWKLCITSEMLHCWALLSFILTSSLCPVKLLGCWRLLQRSGRVSWALSRHTLNFGYGDRMVHILPNSASQPEVLAKIFQSSATTYCRAELPSALQTNFLSHWWVTLDGVVSKQRVRVDRPPRLWGTHCKGNGSHMSALLVLLEDVAGWTTPINFHTVFTSRTELHPPSLHLFLGLRQMSFFSFL